MKSKRIIAGIAGILLASCMLTGCGNGSGETKAKEELVVFNYGEYCEPELLKQFEEETGIHVVYEEYVNPEAMYAKYKAGSIKYDLICTSDYMIEKMINEGEVLPLDMEAIPNVSNIGDSYWEFSKAFDPENQYTVPHFWGTVGILYNEALVEEEVDSWDILWNEKYEGNIIMQNSMRDTLIPALKKLGYSINTTDRNELEEAKNLLLEQTPLVQAYMVDEAREELISENASIALVYSGEAFFAREYNENLNYVVPKEGSNVWMDSWFIPKTCQNMEAAQKFIDFLCREDVAMTNFEYIYYATPNEKVIANLDEETQNDTAIFPSAEVLEKCEVFRSLDQDTMDHISTLWKEIKS